MTTGDQSPQQSMPPAPTPPRKSAPTKAVVALGLAIVGGCGLTAIIAIILGISARRDAKRTGGPTGMATAAIIISIAWLLLLGIVNLVSSTSAPTASKATQPTQTASARPTPTPSKPAPSPTATVDAKTAACNKIETQAKIAAVNGQKSRLNNVMGDAKKAGCDFTRPKLQQPWPPNGYSIHSASGLAYKWVRGGGSDCYRCSYWTMYVMSDTGCPGGIYAELNILDRSGTVIDWTNDTVPSLGIKQRAKLVFETYNRSADTAELTNLICRAY